MSQDYRERSRRITLDVGEVGVAHSGSHQFHQNLVGLWLAEGNVFHAQGLANLV
jgi:hypothetical protein